MMNILLFTTGGTIGSAFDGTAIDVCADGGCAVAEQYAAQHPDVRFDIRSLLNILSETLSADDLNTLAKALTGIDFAACDGVIVTVGSDNLAYVASFIGLLCADKDMPICVVASDKVLSDPAANGGANFACAAELIREGVRGVFVPYRNRDGVMFIHSATDIRQADQSDDFYSFHGAYAVFANGSFTQQNPYIGQRLPAAFDGTHLPQLSDSVLLIHSYPMQDYAALKTDGKKAVLHTLYHSATLDSASVLGFIRTLGNVPLYLASFRKGRKLYRTAVEAIDAGAIPLYDISPECAYMKLLLACAQDQMSVKEFMESAS